MWHIRETGELRAGFGVKSDVKKFIEHRNTGGRMISEIFLILRRTERDIIKNVYRSSCEVPFIPVRF